MPTKAKAFNQTYLFCSSPLFTILKFYLLFNITVLKAIYQTHNVLKSTDGGQITRWASPNENNIHVGHWTQMSQGLHWSETRMEETHRWGLLGAVPGTALTALCTCPCGPASLYFLPQPVPGQVFQNNSTFLTTLQPSLSILWPVEWNNLINQVLQALMWAHGPLLRGHSTLMSTSTLAVRAQIPSVWPQLQLNLKDLLLEKKNNKDKKYNFVLTHNKLNWKRRKLISD